MSKLLLLWGGGGHGCVVVDVARDTRLFERIVVVDDNPAKIGLTCNGIRVTASHQGLSNLAGAEFMIAIGDNFVRARCFNNALELGLRPTSLVHGSAIISQSAIIGLGTLVMPGVIVNAGAVIGDNCIINTGSIIEHGCLIGPHVHISPRVVLGGAVRVGPFAHVGIGAVVLPGATVGEMAIVGGGAVLLREAPPRGTVVGVPARLL